MRGHRRRSPLHHCSALVPLHIVQGRLAGPNIASRQVGKAASLSITDVKASIVFELLAFKFRLAQPPRNRILGLDAPFPQSVCGLRGRERYVSSLRTRRNLMPG